MNEYKKALDDLQDYHNHYHDDVSFENYKLLKELVEKATPKKVKYSYFKSQLSNYHCPNCGEAQGLYVNKRWRNFCDHCGQALDWSVKEDD